MGLSLPSSLVQHPPHPISPPSPPPRYIGFYPITQEVKAKHASKNRPAGTSYTVNDKLDSKKFRALILDKVLPDTLAKAGHFAERVIIQMDSAGGHGGGHSSLYTHTFPSLYQSLRKWGEEKWEQLLGGKGREPPEVLFVAQPARSPDLNCLDLGFWHAVQAGITTHTSNSFDAVGELQRIVLARWEKMKEEDHLTSLFSLIKRNARAIIDVDGGNHYVTPHHSTKRTRTHEVISLVEGVMETDTDTDTDTEEEPEEGLPAKRPRTG